MRHPRALTLIEMMAVMAITTTLVAGSMLAIGRMSRRIQKAQWDDSAALEKKYVYDLLQADFSHATRYRLMENGLGFELETYHNIDTQKQTIRHLPVRVRYSIISTGSLDILLRDQVTIKTERQLDPKSQHTQIIRLETKSLSLASPARSNPTTDEWNDTPSQMTLQIGELNSNGWVFLLKK